MKKVRLGGGDEEGEIGGWKERVRLGDGDEKGEIGGWG